MDALGFFEIQSTTAAIQALDTMLKSASVQFVSCEKRLGGRLVTLIIKGTVSDVTEAIESAKANSIKTPAAHAVIANPHQETWNLVNISAKKYTNKNSR